MYTLDLNADEIISCASQLYVCVTIYSSGAVYIYAHI